MHAYSPPDRFTPQRTTLLLLASIRELPETWRPDVGTGAAVAGVAPLKATTAPEMATAPSASSARPIRFICIACPPLGEVFTRPRGLSPPLNWPFLGRG